MKKTVAWVMILTVFLSQTAWAHEMPEKGGKKYQMPASGPTPESAVAPFKEALEKQLKEAEEPSDFENTVKKIKDVLEKIKDKLCDREDNEKENKGKNDRDNRGDPKTDYDQDENRYHSEHQRPSPSPDPSPSPSPTPLPDPSPLPSPDPSPLPDPTPTPDPSPIPTPDPQPLPSPTPEPTPTYTLDLTTSDWQVANQYQAPTGELWNVYFRPTQTGVYEMVLVSYDMTTSNPISAIGFSVNVVTDMPDLSGLTLALVSTYADGSTVKKYGLFTDSAILWDDVNKWVDLQYDSSGVFVQAVISTKEAIDLATIKLPTLDSLIPTTV